MQLSKVPVLFLVSVSILSIFFPLRVSSQAGLEDVMQLCGNVTAVNKAMAKQAGYDLDQLCSEIASSELNQVNLQNTQIVPRGTASSSENVSISVAPVASVGVGGTASASELKPFGYDLFANAPTTYAPATTVPVSGDYILGPGDTLDIFFYGKVNKSFSLTINREGFVDFPELGPLGLAGLTYAEAKEMLRARIFAQVIGTQVSITMGSLRSIQVFVLGEAFKPGAYTISSLSTITHALVSSGGVSDIGSLRDIQLKRQGKIIAKLDLYDLLLGGDTSKDVRVQASDVIYIPVVGDLVSIEGQVLRPAIYELKGGESVGDLINLAGGLGPKAFGASSRLHRINNSGFMTVLDLNLNIDSGNSLILESGDHLAVDGISEYKKDVINLSGAVRHAGHLSWKKGMRVSDIIFDRDQLNPDADLDIAILIRESKNSADIKILTFNLGNIFLNDATEDNLELASRDQIIILSDYQDRADLLAPFMGNLRRQASIDGLPEIVRSGGTVRFPGEYPLTEGMTVLDLINLSGGLLESAYSQFAEISRISLSDPNKAVRSIVTSDLSRSDFSLLKPNDYVEFRMIPEFDDVETITLEGEFVFPGTYAFEKGETLSSVIDRAGGFTTEAFIDGSIFLRESLKQREQEEIDRLLSLLNNEISSDSLRDANSNVVIDEGKVAAQRAAIQSLSNSVAIGRLVVPLAEIMTNRSEDVVLKNNDRLMVPKMSQEVTIIGEVRRPTSYLFNSDFNESDYIEQSGGYKERADKRNTYIVKAGGEVIIPRRGLFKFVSKKSSISPGDTIVVPLDADESVLRGLPLLAEVSTIIYQLSLGAAAVQSFTNNN